MRDGFTSMFEDGKSCKECTERYVGCHDKCEIYQNALKKWRERGDVIKKNKMVVADYERFRRANIMKSIRKRDN